MLALVVAAYKVKKVEVSDEIALFGLEENISDSSVRSIAKAVINGWVVEDGILRQSE